MKVKTFDMMTGDEIECEAVRVSFSGWQVVLRHPDGREIVRHWNRCAYDESEMKERLKTQK